MARTTLKGEFEKEKSLKKELARLKDEDKRRQADRTRKVLFKQKEDIW